MQVTVEVNFGMFIRKRFTDLYRIYYLGPQNEHRRAVEPLFVVTNVAYRNCTNSSIIK